MEGTKLIDTVGALCLLLCGIVTVGTAVYLVWIWLAGRRRIRSIDALYHRLRKERDKEDKRP